MNWDEVYYDPWGPYRPHSVYGGYPCQKCDARPEVKHRSRVYKLLGMWFWVCLDEHCWSSGAAPVWSRVLTNANLHARTEG